MRKYTAFVSCKFTEKDRSVVELIREVVEAAGLVTYVAREKRAIPPIDKILLNIKECDCLIAVLTRSRKLADRNLYICSDWIQNEIGMALALGKPIIGLYEDRVDIEGVLQLVSDYIIFDRNHLDRIISDLKHLVRDLIKVLDERAKFTPELQREILKDLSTGMAELPEGEIERLQTQGIIIHYGRERVVRAFTSIARRARPGDQLFGHCRTCTLYPRSFYDAIRDAVANTVRCVFVVQEVSDSVGLVRFALGLDRHYMTLKSIRSDDLRIFGLRGQEFLFVLPVADEYVGLHVLHSGLVEYLYSVFDGLWKRARLVRSGKDINW